MKRPSLRLLNSQKQQVFFYAEKEAEMYDDTIDLVVPQYRLLHDTLLHLLEVHFAGKGLGTSDVSATILDVGSGTGAETIGILRRFPKVRVVAMDFCAPMHREFEANCVNELGASALDRVETVADDILGDGGRPESLRSHLPEEMRNGGYDAVVSTFTIHHLNWAQKEEAYRRLYDVLADGGVFINGDLFSYASPTLAEHAQQFDERWIAEQFDAPSSEFKAGGSIPSEKRQELKKLWLEHYRCYNKLDPLDCDPHAWIDGQARLLRQIGFREAGCPMRFWQVGVLWAKR